ncbi:hypothetical protein OESDEN_03291 [Oesophagostomum dentatum]|uniref:Bromo domain-containing protein n=1 Tax=Oesophagostomum dentatum TaxID=61180 RepID=A0A0B1TGT0_OESDE|nr:hypothetical protein OESDEN_03291 [Oesophagostomum dentatum]
MHQDIRQLAVAAEQFNEPSSAIVRNSRIVVEALIRFSRDPLLDDIVNVYDSLFDLPSEQIVEYCRRQLPKIAVDDEILKHLAENSQNDGPIEPGWKTDCRAILRSVMDDPCASHFLEANAATNEDVAAALQQTCDLTSLMEALERGDIDQPATLLHDVEKMVHACKTNIDDKRSPVTSSTLVFVYRDSLALGSLFAERMKGVISQYERIWKSLIDPAGRSLRKRSHRERAQSKYNTRSHDRKRSSNFDPLQPSTSQSNRTGVLPGYYRDLVNGRVATHTSARRSSTRRVSPSTNVSPLLRSRAGHSQDHVATSDDSAPSISSPIRNRTSARKRQLDRELPNDSANFPASSAALFSSPPSSVPRSDDEPHDESIPGDNEDDDSPQEDYEEDALVRSSRTKPKRKVRRSSEESEDTPCSQPTRRNNGRYSTRSANSAKRRRIESESEQELSPRRNRSTRRNVTNISYAESDEDSAPDFPEMSSRGRLRKPRRAVHY